MDQTGCFIARSSSESGILVLYRRKYPDKIRIINKENGGQATARNLGISEAKGEYIGFVDYQWEKDFENIKNKMFDVSVNAANKYVIIMIKNLFIT